MGNELNELHIGVPSSLGFPDSFTVAALLRVVDKVQHINTHLYLLVRGSKVSVLLCQVKYQNQIRLSMS